MMRRRGSGIRIRSQRIQHRTDTPHEVKLDDGTPQDTFFAEGVGRVEVLELCAAVGRIVFRLSINSRSGIQCS